MATRLRDADDLALAVGLVLFTLGILAAIVLVLLFTSGDDAGKEQVLTGLLMALASATAFFFRGRR
jgi:type II secretory pathway pseudopilin PulG